MAEIGTSQNLVGWDTLLRCPRCRGSFEGTPHAHRTGRVCTACACCYPVIHGIPRLLDPARRETLDYFCERYDAVRLREGWAGDLPGYYEALPFEDLTGKHAAEWRLRTVSYRRLERWIGRAFGTKRLRILDAGAGSGWMSRLLATSHDVMAMDANAGPHGLDAIPAGRRQYAAIQGELERIPLADDSFNMVIANASLHYTRTPHRFLQEAHRVLSSEGRVVVMDSPMYPTQAAADRAHERTQAYYAGLGEPDMAQYYAGLVASLFDDVSLFRIRYLRRDLSGIERCKKWLRERIGYPSGARFPMVVGDKN